VEKVRHGNYNLLRDFGCITLTEMEVIAMPGSNYSKQLIKRQRISRTTLVVGMDIGNKFNAMVLMPPYFSSPFATPLFVSMVIQPAFNVNLTGG
jgi:hypothetical protein